MSQIKGKLLIPLSLVLNIISFSGSGQTIPDSCNQVGAWIWHVEHTNYSHAQLADTLVSYGFKRAYIKVAQGTIIPTWSELIDTALVNDYHNAGLEIWAWSYNRVGDDSLQAEAAYIAAQTGYDGYVIDVEMEYDGDSTNLSNLCTSFRKAIDRAELDGFADSTYQLYVTTWGNPIDHNFYINAMDPWVDGYMPQTYVEYWGQSYIDDLVFWIDSGTREYEFLGATKPVHHLMSTATGAMTPSDMDAFIQATGPEASVWRVPGSSVPMSVWKDWRRVNWGIDYCAPNFSIPELHQFELFIYPNPGSSQLYLEAPKEGLLKVRSMTGQVLFQKLAYPGRNPINIEALPSGLYLVELHTENGIGTTKLIKP